jgi:hypothetical protein
LCIIDRSGHGTGWCVGGVHLIFPRQGGVHFAQPTSKRLIFIIDRDGPGLVRVGWKDHLAVRTGETDHEKTLRNYGSSWQVTNYRPVPSRGFPEQEPDDEAQAGQGRDDQDQK